MRSKVLLSKFVKFLWLPNYKAILHTPNCLLIEEQVTFIVTNNSMSLNNVWFKFARDISGENLLVV